MTIIFMPFNNNNNILRIRFTFPQKLSLCQNRTDAPAITVARGMGNP